MAEHKASERLAAVREKLGAAGEAIFMSQPLNRRGLAAEDAELAAKVERLTNERERSELERLESKAPLTARLRRLHFAREFTAADIFKQANAFGLRQEAERLNSEPTAPEPPDAA